MMDGTIVAPPATNGTRPLTALGQQALTTEVMTSLATYGFQTLFGQAAVACLEPRTTPVIDPELFLTVAGRRPAAYAALTVSVTKARALLSEEALRDISETKTTLALRVTPRRR